MAILTILRYPDPRLHTVASPVTHVDDGIRALIRNMAETMYAAPGVGLAATQVNVHKRVIVMDVSENHDQLIALINPEIIASEGVAEKEEGCLSVPGIFERLKRAARVTVSGLDMDGNPVRIDAQDLLATCVQHEIDHLNGKVFVEYLSQLKQSRIKNKLKKHQREAL